MGPRLHKHQVEDLKNPKLLQGCAEETIPLGSLDWMRTTSDKCYLPHYN